MTLAQLHKVKPDFFHIFSHDKIYFFYNIATNELFELQYNLYDKFRDWQKSSKSLIRFPEVIKFLKEKYDTLENIEDFCKKDNIFQTDLQNFGPYIFHQPKRIQIAISQNCNLACKYCYLHKCEARLAEQNMSESIAKKAIDYFVKESGRRKKLTIAFIGGEPLMNFPVLKSIM